MQHLSPGSPKGTHPSLDNSRDVKIFGQEIQVKAAIYTIGGLSAHADQADLLNWLRHFEKMPEKIFIVHGELSNSKALADAIQDKLHWHASLPEYLSIVSL